MPRNRQTEPSVACTAWHTQFQADCEPCKKLLEAAIEDTYDTCGTDIEHDASGPMNNESWIDVLVDVLARGGCGSCKYDYFVQTAVGTGELGKAARRVAELTPFN